MKANLFRELAGRNTPVEVQAGQTIKEALPDLDLSNAIIHIDGKTVKDDHILQDGETVTIRLVPGWTATAIVLAVVAGITAIAAGVASYKAKLAAEKAKKDLEKLKNAANKSEIDNRPFLRGASNEYATGKQLPYIVGKSFFTPYLLCSSFYEISGADGVNQFTNNILACGFNKQVFHQIAIDDVVIKKYTGTAPQEGASAIDPGIFADGGSIEIAQDGNPLSSLPALNYKVDSHDCQEEIPKDSVVSGGTKDYLTYTLDPYAKNVDIAITFPYGLYEIDDSNKKKSTSVTITPQYSLDGGNTWINFTFSGVLQTTTTKYEGKYTFGRKSYYGSKYVKNHPELWVFESGTDVRNSSQTLDIDVKYIGDYDDDRGCKYSITASYKQTTSSRISTNVFARNEPNKELRYVAHKDFSLSDYRTLYNNNQTAIYIRLRSNGSTDSKCHNECYCLYYQSVCFDPAKSSVPAGVLSDGTAGLVSCRVIESREQAFCTLLGIRLKASDNNKDKLKKINTITTGTARTWNGTQWSNTKTATRNPAAWALEIETSDRHPASRRLDSEIDLDSYGVFYEYCEQNNFYFDYALTTELKKDDLINYIMEATGACFYTDIYGRRSIAIDKAQENAVNVYNPQNIISIQNKKTFGRRTDGLRIKYINSANELWQEDTYIVMREVNGEALPLTNDSLIKDIDATGITTHEHVVKYARRLMAIEALRPKTTTIEVGNEGVFLTPYSKVLLQDDSLKIGTGHAVISELGYIGGRLVRIYLNGKVTFEAGKEYGVIISCTAQDGTKPLSLKVEGEGYTDKLIVISESLETDGLKPEEGNVLSFGELDSDGEFTRIATPYLISQIKRSDRGFTLDLVNYDEAIYDSGTIPEYKSNITQKPSDSSAEIPPGYVTREELDEALDNIISSSPEIPDTPTGVRAVATERGFELSCAVNNEGLRNDIQNVVFTIKRPNNTEESVVANGIKGVYYFDREIDGYPEADVIQTYRITAIAINIYGGESEESTAVAPDTDSYGTWIVGTPVLTLRTNKRSLHVHMEQPAQQRPLYGIIRYRMQISRYDDVAPDTMERIWYKPDLSVTADPYGAETSYKVDTDPAPVPDYVLATADYSQTVPLEGQSRTPASPSDTIYYFRINAVNETTGVVGNPTETGQMTARATGARDVVLARLGDGSQHPDALTAKHIYAKDLTAISGNFSQIKGDTETSDNYWKGMDTNEPEFRVGNDIGLESQKTAGGEEIGTDDDDAEYMHYVHGHLWLKLKSFVIKTRETLLNGAMSLYNAAKNFRNYLDYSGITAQAKDGSNWVDKGFIRFTNDGSVMLTNTPDSFATYRLEPPANTTKIYHLDVNISDTDGNNTENLVIESGACGAISSPVLDVRGGLRGYFQGVLKKAGVTTKHINYNVAAFWSNSNINISAVHGNEAAGYKIVNNQIIPCVVNIETDVITEYEAITYITSEGFTGARAWKYGSIWNWVFTSVVYSSALNVYFMRYVYYDSVEGHIWGGIGRSAGFSDGVVYAIMWRGGSTVYEPATDSQIMITKHNFYRGSRYEMTTYTIPDGFTIKVGAARGEYFFALNASGTLRVYHLPDMTYREITNSDFSSFVDNAIYSWEDPQGIGYVTILGSIRRYVVKSDDLTVFQIDFAPVGKGGVFADETGDYILGTDSNKNVKKYYSDGTAVTLGVGVSSNLFLPDDRTDKVFTVSSSGYYFPGVNQSLVAEKHYAFWFRGGRIRFGKVTIETSTVDWLYCRITATGNTVSWYIVRPALVGGELDVFKSGSESLAGYGLESDNDNLDFILDGAVEEFTVDNTDIPDSKMLQMVQYKLPYGNGILPESDQFIVNAKYPEKVISNAFWCKNEEIITTRPPLGVPTIWMGNKPDWALDFGNGANYKYLWENYPKLNNDQFKDILMTLSNKGWMTAYDASGFYVPDLRGIAPIGYGTNAKRTGETTAGGVLGAYSASANKSHGHNVQGYVSSVDLNHSHAISVNDKGRPDGGGDSPSDKYKYWNSLFANTGRQATANLGTSWNHNHSLNIDTTSEGTVAKPPTIACMWIVRFI